MSRFTMKNIGLLLILSLSSIMYGNDLNDALIKAVSNGNLKEVKALIKNGADVNTTNKYDRTALMISITKGYTKIATYLLKKGINTNNMTIVDWARPGWLEKVKDLIDKDFDINTQDKSGTTALMCASDTGNIELVQYLVAKGADLNIQNKYGNTTLIKAAENGFAHIIKLLIDAGANINIVGELGQTALHWASYHGDLGVVKNIVENGANLSIKNHDSKTPLDIATSNEYTEIVEYLGSL